MRQRATMTMSLRELDRLSTTVQNPGDCHQRPKLHGVVRDAVTGLPIVAGRRLAA